MDTKSQALFKFYMDNCFVLPLELKNDLVYCQRAMQDFLKVHGVVSDVFKEQAASDRIQMKRILRELEKEIYEINAEQQYLMICLNHHLKNFNRKLHDNGIQTLPDCGSEYISNLVVPLIVDESYQVHPRVVTPRDTMEMLIRKHFLVSQEELNGRPRSPVRLSELDENIPLMLVTDNEGKEQHQDPTQESSSTTPFPPPPSHIETLKLRKKFGEESIIQTTKKCSSSVAVMIVPDSVLKSNRQPPPLSKMDDHSLPMPRDRSATDDQPFPWGIRAVLPEPVKYYRQKSDMKPVKRLVNSRPPLASITQPRQALKRARKTKQVPRLLTDDDSMVLISMLDQEQGQEPPSICPVGVVSMLEVTQTKQYMSDNAQGARKSDDVGSLSIPASLNNSNQEAYEQQRSCMQLINEPRETRVQPTEYGQEEFLRLFALYTHDVANKLNQRCSKRTRRTVKKANRVDFHYGDLLNCVDVSCVKKLKAKPGFLLSPREKRLNEQEKHKAVIGRNTKSSATEIEAKCEKCRKH